MAAIALNKLFMWPFWSQVQLPATSTVPENEPDWGRNVAGSKEQRKLSLLWLLIAISHDVVMINTCQWHSDPPDEYENGP